MRSAGWGGRILHGTRGLVWLLSEGSPLNFVQVIKYLSPPSVDRVRDDLLRDDGGRTLIVVMIEGALEGWTPQLKDGAVWLAPRIAF